MSTQRRWPYMAWYRGVVGSLCACVLLAACSSAGGVVDASAGVEAESTEPEQLNFRYTNDFLGYYDLDEDNVILPDKIDEILARIVTLDHIESELPPLEWFVVDDVEVHPPASLAADPEDPVNLTNFCAEPRSALPVIVTRFFATPHSEVVVWHRVIEFETEADAQRYFPRVVEQMRQSAECEAAIYFDSGVEEFFETDDERGKIATVINKTALSADWDDAPLGQGDWLRALRQEEELTIEPTLYLQSRREARLVGNRISDIAVREIGDDFIDDDTAAALLDLAAAVTFD